MATTVLSEHRRDQVWDATIPALLFPRIPRPFVPPSIERNVLVAIDRERPRPEHVRTAGPT
ncbi:hypothetical protein FHR84_002740 [Actinopolyspora biskrensis]|uniref:Uncharacterized protein n=1 Tax=Actinopolyspora biskrensis TaxID=1470178 RepID=A0A852Z765_9ACTN|nr:hypothetical protein [Actinopolyspora biskrensis]